MATAEELHINIAKTITIKIKRGLVIFKTPITRPLHLLALFTIYAEYMGLLFKTHWPKNINHSKYEFSRFETPLQGSSE